MRLLFEFIVPLILATLLGVSAANAQLAAGNWKTDVSKRSIDLSELVSGGPPKDGIPAIDNPSFVPSRLADAWLDGAEPVIAVEAGGIARAYPLQILMWHELVNDTVGELSVLVSYCPLCNSAVVFNRRLDGTVYDFGVSGMLRHRDMVMYDRQTDSLWQQLTGEAIVGTMTGRRLQAVRSQTVAFRDFTRAFPDGEVLSRETGFRRNYGRNPYVGYEFKPAANRGAGPGRAPRTPKDRILAIAGEKKSLAYPFSYLRRRGVVHGRFAGSPHVVFWMPGTVTPLDKERIAESRDVGAAGVFSPVLDGRRLKFHRRNDKIVDRQTGSEWDVLGRATTGPLAGRRLQPVEHGVFFAFAWLVFHPDTLIVGEPESAGTEPWENAPAETGHLPGGK